MIALIFVIALAIYLYGKFKPQNKVCNIDENGLSKPNNDALAIDKCQN